MERTVAALRIMREFTDFDNQEFRALPGSSPLRPRRNSFRAQRLQAERKELDTLFKVLDNLVKTDESRFGKFHILAMELSTRILRSRKKAMDLLLQAADERRGII